MKFTGLAIVFLLVYISAFAAFPIAKTKDSSSNSSFTITSFESLHARDLEKISGKKLTWVQRLEFTMLKRQLHKHDSSDKNNDLNAICGFVLGFYFSVIGVAIAFLASKNRTLRKWTIIGACTGLILAVVFLAIWVSLFLQVY